VEKANVIHFDVLGDPVTKGDKRVGQYGQLYEARAHELKAWRDLVAYSAVAARRGFTFDAPAHVALEFRLRRGGDGYGKKNDVDKLARAVLDALVDGRLLHDDALVTRLLSMKEPAGDGPPGVRVTVLDAQEGLWLPA
jgi:Holliday junction resolvase RusA-like endonuclease